MIGKDFEKCGGTSFPWSFYAILQDALKIEVLIESVWNYVKPKEPNLQWRHLYFIYFSIFKLHMIPFRLQNQIYRLKMENFHCRRRTTNFVRQRVHWYKTLDQNGLCGSKNDSEAGGQTCTCAFSQTFKRRPLQIQEQGIQIRLTWAQVRQTK